ncbi:MAG: hypothetical protein JKY65_22415 [Planctomycetes bacterium]|nr:hypothetical protein [Planctomycetota bacterium]
MDDPDPEKKSKLYQVGHILVALGLIYAPVAYLGSGTSRSSAELAGMIAVPAGFIGLGGLLMFLGRRRDA